jgi:hypothetical protein
VIAARLGGFPAAKPRLTATSLVPLAPPQSRPKRIAGGENGWA